MENPITEEYQGVRKEVAKRRAYRIFYSHMAAYIIGNVFLGVWNILTYFIKDDTTLWFFVPLIFWGIGLLIHYIQGVALFNDWWDNDARETRERLTEMHGAKKAVTAKTDE
ncbi:MAG: 2TM domain-containing protein [SAR202 cluster bacterium]|nr:2TM domain-containing protein [SAR202 cluster bacterium]